MLKLDSHITPLRNLDSHDSNIEKFKTITFGKIDCIETICINNRHAKAIISLFGGQVLSYLPSEDNRERLWVSSRANFNGLTPIRGGIPICWPWFADSKKHEGHNLPSHGFLRTQNWKIDSIQEIDDATILILRPRLTRQPYFNYQIDVSLKVIIGKTLTLVLSSTNVSDRPVPLTCALHSYFLINNISNTIISGISGDYRDKTQNGKITATPIPYVIENETDNIHITSTEFIQAFDSSYKQVLINLKTTGHDSVIVWNPGEKVANKMKDMEKYSYKTMLCIENAKLADNMLQPNETINLVKEIY